MKTRPDLASPARMSTTRTFRLSVSTAPAPARLPVASWMATSSRSVARSLLTVMHAYALLAVRSGAALAQKPQQ